MEIVLDLDVQAVAEFMQSTIPATKLVSVADNLPTVARLLWSHFPQESCHAATFNFPKTGQESRSLSDATESFPDKRSADGDSAGEGASQ
jgi:hypothetical protein